MCRFIALQSLQLPWISQKRATILAQKFVAGVSLPSVKELCQSEPFAIPKRFLCARPCWSMHQCTSCKVQLNCCISTGTAKRCCCTVTAVKAMAQGPKQHRQHCAQHLQLLEVQTRQVRGRVDAAERSSAAAGSTLAPKPHS